MGNFAALVSCIGSVSPPPVLLLVFQANVPNEDTGFMDDVAVGVGGLPEARAGALWAKDFEGIYREFPAQVPARSGGRVVWNYCPEYNDISMWVAVNVTHTYGIEDKDGGNTATRVQATVGGGNSYINVDVPDGQTRNTLWIRRVSGSGIVRLYSGDGTASQAINGIDSAWKRFASGVVTSVGASNNRIGVRILTAGDTVELQWAQSESVTGQSNQNPSEVIPTAGSVGYKVSAHYNGNSVVDNVVTEALGALLPATPRLVHQPEATNTFLNNYAPVTQTITAPTGTHTCWLEGTGSVTLSGGLAGVVTDGNPVTGDPAGADVICTVSGTPDFGMFEDNAVPTAPIPTTGSAVTRPACDLSFDAANHDEARGAYYIEMGWPLTVPYSASYATTQVINWDPSNINIASSGLLRSTDGSSSIVSGVVPAGDSKIGLVYDAAALLRSIYLNSDSTIDAAFDGVQDGDSFDLAALSNTPMSFGVIERYDVDYEAGKVLIEEKLA